jgi:predicted  nucleic acid-binding Zn-ribbon protein
MSKSIAGDFRDIGDAVDNFGTRFAEAPEAVKDASEKINAANKSVAKSTGDAADAVEDSAGKQEKALGKASSAIDAYKKKLQDAAKASRDISENIKDTLDDIATGANQSPDDLDALDVTRGIDSIGNALNRQNFDAAQRQIENVVEIIGKLNESGAAGDQFLTVQLDRLQELADRADSGITGISGDAAQEETAKVVDSIDQIKQAAETPSTLKFQIDEQQLINLGQRAGTIFANAMQQRVNEIPIQPNINNSQQSFQDFLADAALAGGSRG